MELYFEDETSLEGAVEVGGEVGGGDEYALEVLQLLKDDVLHGVVHFVDRLLYVLRALVDERVGLIEEEDGLNVGVATEDAIALEDVLDVLLALTYELVAHAGNVDLHDVAASLSGELEHGLGLASAWSPVEQACESLAHALLLEALLDAAEVLGREHTCETVDLLLVGVVVEECLGLDCGMRHEETVVCASAFALALLLAGLIG